MASKPVTSTKKIQWIIKNVTRANIDKYKGDDNRFESYTFNVILGDDFSQW